MNPRLSELTNILMDSTHFFLDEVELAENELLLLTDEEYEDIVDAARDWLIETNPWN